MTARLRLAVGAGVIALLLWRVGAGPVLDGVRAVDGRTLALGVALGVPTTVCCAWRWAVVAGGLGVGLPLRAAVASSYRAQFLNSTLPGGILGDVHRAVDHGRRVGDRGAGLRSVVWERVAGQWVQLTLTGAALLAFAPVPHARPAAAVVVVVALAVPVGLGLLGRGTGHHTGHHTAHHTARRTVQHTVQQDLHDGLLTRHAGPRIALASTLAVAGHVATFLVAARAAGVTASATLLVPLALLVLLAMAVPANVAGWGPREGVAAWVFGAAGLGAGLGVTTAVAYGVIVLVGSLPGALVLLGAGSRGRG